MPLVLVLPVVEILEPLITPACVTEAVFVAPLYTDSPVPVVVIVSAFILPLSITAEPYDTVIVVPFETTFNEFVLYVIVVAVVCA